MEFLISGQPSSRMATWLADGLRGAWEASGYRLAQGSPSPSLVLQHVDPAAVHPYRRRSQATFLVGLVVLPEPPADPLAVGYPLLVRSLSNLLVLMASERADVHTWFVTPERGCYRIPPAASDDVFFALLRDRMRPLASATLIVDNVFDPDLPREFWNGSPETEALANAARRLDRLGVLPAPFPLREVLPPRDMRLLERLYSLGGLSYGNLSLRAPQGGFWMSGSGVDKANLRVVGRDVLLVKDYDAGRNAMVLSVPPNFQPNRVSVDAIEHWTIYREHPGVGAILHVHAWIEGTAQTSINYPCGSIELAQAVADAVRQAPDPRRAVVGLVNHGLTLTGPDLDDIFARVEGRLLTQVPSC